MAANSGNMAIEQEHVERTNGGIIQNDNDDNDNNAIGMAATLRIASDNITGDWRKTLSGALDERRLFFALVVLLIFYTGYTIGNSYHDNNVKDEDYITHNCTCKSSHRLFYASWLAICSILWTIFHLLAYAFSIIIRCFKKCCSCSCSCLVCCNQETICEQSKCKSACDGKDKKCCSQCCIACCKIKSCIFDKDDIHRYEYYLWTQYYELYTIGITKDIKMFNDRSVIRIFTNHLKDKNKDETDNSRNPEIKIKDKNKNGSENKISAHDDILACPIKYYTSDNWCGYVAQYIIHIILFAIRLLAQLAIVPFLMIQMFDTYAFLCLAAKSYCTADAGYNLHLDQTAITFAFYCSLMLAYVTSIMLRWIPRPIITVKEPSPPLKFELSSRNLGNYAKRFRRRPIASN